jgi:hypothetical protein
MIHSKKRIGVAAVTAAASMAGVFALPNPAHAASVHPDPVRNATAAGGENTISVNWDAPDTGEPATSYVVVVYNKDGVQIGDPHVVLAPTTELTLVDVPAGEYYTAIYSHNAYPGFGGPVYAPGTGTIVVTKPVTGPVAPVVRNTLPYRPYKNWADMIDQEYRMWTGCSSDPDVLEGRFPRDDEFTYWYNKLTSWAWNDVDDARYDDALWIRRTEEWSRLTNGSTFTPFVLITDADAPNYKTSIAYKALYDKEYKRLTTIPTAGGFMPADDGTGAGSIANNNILEAGELANAKLLADLYARWPQFLIDMYAADVNAVAENDARNDVYFGRRLDFVRQLAEDAEQTEGPAYRLYTAYFSRIPDAGGLCFWSNRLRDGWSLLDVSEFFVESDEFEETYGGFDLKGDEDSIDAAEFVSLVYRNVLNREADAAGAAFWTRQLQSERYSPAEMLIGFSESQEFKNVMSSKVGTGLAYLHLLGRMPTESEYVAADWNWTYFQTNPTEMSWGFWFWSYWGWSAPNSLLYQVIVDNPNGEYTDRAGIEIPSHHHPHEDPGTQPL